MDKIKEKLKKINFKYLHIAIILIGIIFISISIFHANMWFDESYSVAMARHTFTEIWQIGESDVHPMLYYFCLHILYLIFGNNIIIYRIFSVAMIALLGILGYTHIRKDFDEKTGLIFSFLAFFLPMTAQYAGEIRMYPLGMLLGTIMAIYAYRIYKGKINKSTYFIFGISSLLLAYTHYYGLMLAGIVNLLVFVYLCKNAKQRKSDLKKFTITAVLQVLAYIPCLIILVKQITGVAAGFWAKLSFPETIYDVLTLQYRGNLTFQPIILSTIFYAYIVYMVYQTQKQERKPATWCFMVYTAIILIALLASLCIKSVILVNRYLLIVTGLLIFGLAFFMAKDTKKWRVITICAIIIVVSIISNISIIKENYNPHNKDCVKYLQENIQDNDIIVYSNVLNGAIIVTDLSSNINITSYFYNKDDWKVYESYKSYSPYMEIKATLEEILDNYSGRVWLIEGENTHSLQDEIESKYNITKLEDKQFISKYKDYRYTIELIEVYR